MSDLGSLHVAAAVLALVTAALVLMRTKGTTAHVRLGRVYAVLLVLVDVVALLTYQDGVGPGPFHLLAVVSLATLTAALLWSPRRRGSRQTHGILMIWSVAGLAGAGLAQGRPPPCPTQPPGRPWPAPRPSACWQVSPPGSSLPRSEPSRRPCRCHAGAGQVPEERADGLRDPHFEKDVWTRQWLDGQQRPSVGLRNLGTPVLRPGRGDVVALGDLGVLTALSRDSSTCTDFVGPRRYDAAGIATRASGSRPIWEPERTQQPSLDCLHEFPNPLARPESGHLAGTNPLVRSPSMR